MHHKTVVVIGASSGMGLAAARRFWERGASVWMIARDPMRLHAAAAGIGHERLHALPADVASAEGRARILAAIERMDHLVFTAADLVYKSSRELDEAELMRAVSSKVVGPYLLAAAAAAKMPADGSVTIVSGIAAERPMVGGSVTGMVNGAINAMVRGLALELAPIRVNAVSPGWVDTPFWRQVASDERRESLFAGMREKIPTRRIGTVEDVAQMIEVAACNRGVSGSTLCVDGGQRLV
ncbi:SDR family oxidoreductase [Fulvimonas sp. R45]|uniref:SDR family oxidoreductase n=1 Tax=Fulvimonas sp. R45 TaxID=3045937 RepID=UPI00265DE1B6|nr:SDR family oxidoreductase [Fulvimonas sp. R45]MDO1528213.1 SDR family oxidoreductase [Fulvimonas sp. R45]